MKTPMDYGTYAYLRDLLEIEREKIIEDYRISLIYLGHGKLEVAREQMRRSYEERMSKLTIMENQLRYAAGMSHGPNATEAMKKFWGLDE